MRTVSRNWTSAPFVGHFNSVKTEFLLNNDNNSVRISRGTLLYYKAQAVNAENHTEHTSTLPNNT